MNIIRPTTNLQIAEDSGSQSLDGDTSTESVFKFLAPWIFI